MSNPVYLSRYLLLFFILILASFLRFYQLGHNPPSLNWDETSIGYNAYSILKTGGDEYGNFFPSSFRSFDDYKPPVYIYLAVPSIAIFGLNSFAVRLPAVMIGILFVVMMYFFIKEFFSSYDKKNIEKWALLSSFFLAISPWHLQFSRAAYEASVGVFFLFSSLLFFIKATKKPIYYVLFCIFFILSMYSYHSFRLLNPLLLGFLIILFRKEILRQKLIFSISLIIVLVFTQSIYVNFFRSHDTSARLSMVTVFENPDRKMESAIKVSKAKEENDVLGQIIYNRRFIFIPDIIKGYLDHFKFDYLFVSGDGGVQHHAYKMGMLYIWDFPFIILGFLGLLKRIDRKIFLLILIFFLSVIPSSITTGTPHPVRSIAMMPAFHIITAFGFMVFLDYIFRIKTGYIVAGIIIFSLFVNIGYYLYQYHLETPREYGYFWQAGNKEVIEYAKTHERSFKKIYISYMYDQPYIYYLFYNKIDPSWYQKNWNYSKTGEIGRFYRKIGKYEFKKIDYSRDALEKNVLLIAAPDELPYDITVDHVIYFPDGRIAYKIIAL